MKANAFLSHLPRALIVWLALISPLAGAAARAQTSAEDFYARGFARHSRGDLDGAIADYDRAIISSGRL